jgi:chromosome segregation ATPase
MKTMRFNRLQLLVVLSVAMIVAGSAVAQQAPTLSAAGVVPGTPPTKVKPPKLSPEERELDRIQQSLPCTDDEWNAMRPLIARVYALQNELRNTRDRSYKAPKEGQPVKPQKKDKGDKADRADTLAVLANQATQDPAIEAAHELRDALQTPETPLSELKQRILATRQARAKVRAELTQAQEQLREVTSVHQEAALMLLGILDY